MATTAVDIPAPICETREEQGGDQVDQATSILISKLPNEEKSQAHTHNGLSIIEGGNFLTPPSIGEVHCEVNDSSPAVSMATEKPEENDIVPLGKHKSDDQPTEITANEEETKQKVEESNGLNEEETKQTEDDILEIPKSGNILENPAESLHVASENIEVGGQEKNIKSFPEDQSTKGTLHEKLGGETEEKSIGAVDTQKEILENDLSNVYEGVKGNSTEHGEPRNVEICESESTQSTELKIESKMEKAEDTLHAISENIHTPEIETRSCTEEQSVGILDEKTEDEAVNAAEIEGITENVPTVVSIENTEDDSLIQVGDAKIENEVKTEKDAEHFTRNIVDEVKIDDENPSRAELLEEGNTESAESLHATSFLEEKSPTENPQEILGKETGEKTIDDFSNEDNGKDSLIQVDAREMEQDTCLEKETESINLAEPKIGEVHREVNNSSTDEKVEDGKQTEEDILENPAESLHVAPENIEASILGQERNIADSPEDQSTKGTLHENVGGETEEKSIDAVETQKEVLESLPTIASSSPEEGSTNAVLLEASSDCTNEKIIDGTGTQEVLENDLSNVPNEGVKGNSTEHGEPRNVEFYENESAESAVPKIESKIEKSEDFLHATSEDINAPEIETRSCTEEQSVATHPQGILDEKTEDEAVDAAEIEGITKNVPTVASIEKTEDNSLIQVGDPKVENEDRLEKDADHFTRNIVDEVKIDDENPSRTELLEEENTESAESLHATVEDRKPSDLDQHTETTSLLKEKSPIENPQEILSEETAINVVSNEDNGKDSLIQVDAREMEQDTYLEKETESINLAEPKIGEVHCEVNNSSPDVSMLTEKPDQIVKDETDIGKPKTDDQPTAIAEELDGLDKEETKESKTHMLMDEKVEDGKQTEEDILENPAESLHVAPENIEASYLGQERNITSFPEDQSTNETLHEDVGGETEEKSIDAVETQEENLESLPTIASSSPEEGSTNAVLLEVSSDCTNEKIIDGTGAQEEVLENDLSNEDVKGNSTEHGEPRNVEFCENESTESAVPKIESKIEKSEDSLQATSEDINAPEIETRSCTEEQSVAAHPQEILDEKTQDEAVDAAEIEGITETVPIEKTEDNSCPKMENEEHLEKEAEKPSPVEDFKGNIVTDEVKIDDKSPSRAELLEEENTESALLKEEVQKEKPLESSHEVLEDIKSSDFDQQTETASFLEEKSLTENPQESLGEETEEKTEEAHEVHNVTTEVQYGHTEENSDIKASDSSQDTNNFIAEQLPTANLEEFSSDQTEKESVDAAEAKEETVEDIVKNIPDGDNADDTPIVEYDSQEPSLKDTTEELAITHEAKHVGEDEKITECTLVKEEVSTELSALGQHEETSSQGIMDDTKEDKANDAIVVEEETIEDKENIGKTTPYEEKEENMLVQEDCPQLEQEKDLENDSEYISSREVLIGETTEDSLDKEEAHPVELLQVPTEDIKVSESCQETHSTDEKIPSADPEEIPCDKTEEITIDSAYTENENLELQNVENVPNEGSDNSQGEVEGPEKIYLEETSIGNSNDAELTIKQDAKFADENIVKADLLGNEESIECALVKEEVTLKSLQEEAQEEKPIESLQEAQEEIKAFDSSQDTNSCIEEKSLTAYPQEISSDKTESESIDAINMREESVKDILDGDDAVNSPTEDVSQKTCLKEDTTRNDDDDESTVTNEAKLVGENEEDVECTLVKEEVSTELLQVPAQDTNAEEETPEDKDVATEDVEASDSCQETSSVEEKILMGNSQEIPCDRIEEKAIDAAYTKQENLEEVATKIPNASDEDNSPIQVDVLQKPLLEEASTVMHEAKFADESKVTADLFQNETETECGLVEEEVSVKSLQVENEDIKPTVSSQDREIVGDYREGKTIDVTEFKEEALEDKSNATSGNSLIQADRIQLEQNENMEKASESTSLAEVSTEDTVENILVKEKAEEKDHHIETLQVATEDIKASSSCQETSPIGEKILTGDSQEISCDKTEEKKESFEDAAINVSSGNNEDSSTIEVDGSEKPSLKEASTENTNDHESTIRHDTKFAEDLSENEKNIECDFVNKEASARSLDIIDVTDLKEVTHEDKSNATISDENTTENSSGQVDCSQLELNEHSEKDNEVTSLTEALAMETTESTLVKEEAQTEDHTESLEVATENIIAFSQCQDNEKSSNEEQVLIADPEDISRDEIIEKTIDASDNEKPSEVQVENEDIKVTASSQDKETSNLEEHGLNTNPQGIMGDHKEDKTVEEDKGCATTSYEDSKESSFVQVDCPVLDHQNEHLEKDSESTSLTEATAADTIKSTFVMEEATEDVKAFAPYQDTITSSTQEQILTVDPEDISRDETIENTIDASDEEKTLEVQEKNTEGVLKEDVYIESSQEATEDIKASNTSEDREAHSQEEKILGANPEGPKDENRESETLPKDEVPKEIENIELKEEEDLKDMSTSALHEEKDSDSIAVKIPCTKDFDVVDEDSDSKQEESSITEVPEVHENVPDVTSLVSEVVEEANSCGDKTDIERVEAEAQFPDGEKEAEQVQHDPTTEIDQKDLEGQLLIKDSHVISESKGVNDEEEKTDSDNCKREMTEEVENEEAQKQEEELHVSDEKTTECNEGEIVEDKIENREGDDRTERFFDDKKATESEQEEAVQTTTSTSDFHPVLPSEISKVDHSVTEGVVATDRDEMNVGKIAPDGNEDTRIDNNKSITVLESKNDDEAPEVIQTIPTGEQRSEYEPNIQVLETVPQVQSCEIAAETEETKIEEENLETAGEIESDKVVAEDISGQEETKHETEILKTKEGDEEVEDFHQGSHQEEVIIGSHLDEEANQEEEISTGFEDIKKENETEKVSTISKEADDKALEEPEEIFLGKESIDRGLDQKEKSNSVQEVKTEIDTADPQEMDVGCAKIGDQSSNEEINRPTVAFPDEEENRTGADDTENEIAEDEGLINQNSKIPEINAATREMPKELDENITCEAPIVTFHKTIEESEAKKEQKEILPLPELVQGKDSEKQNQEDEICGSEEVQPSNEENASHSKEKGEEESKEVTWSKPNEGEETETCVEPEQLDFSFHTKDISEVPISDDAQVIPEGNESFRTRQIPTVSDDTELTEQASEATRITTEKQEPEAVISSQAALPNATEVESRQVEEANDKCKVVAETSKITLEVEDQQSKLHNLPQEENIPNTEVIAEKNDPENLQNVREVNQDAQGSNEFSFEVSNKENPVEASLDENIKTSEEQEMEAVQNASVLENLEQERKEKAGKVSESKTYPSLADDTAQCDKVEGSPRQIDSLSILPESKCSEIETTEKDIPAHSAGVNATGVTELAETPLPSKDKHVLAEANHTTVLSSENANGNEKSSTECSKGERDLLEPSKVEQQAPDCGNQEKKYQETSEKPESKEANEPSLSDLFDVSMRKNSKMAEHCAIDEEPTTHTEDQHAEKPDEDQHENAKTEEENNDEDELSEQKRSEQSSESPVMVEMADADVKVSHKKSHNILSGVGSKVKHSIAKVKKAITGKSSHPKPPSPKKTQVEK